MSKEIWNTITPMSGSKNGVVNVGASAHTGRLDRRSIAAFKAEGAADCLLTSIQKAYPQFTRINDISVTAEGGDVTITGKSNSNRLTFSLGTGDIEITLPEQYSAAGTITANAANISDDPGASAEFDFSLTISVPENPAAAIRQQMIIVMDAGNREHAATIRQAAGEPTLAITPTTVMIDAAGTPVSVTVKSKKNWIVEE